MDTVSILTATAVVGGCGLLIGAGLGLFQKLFAVPTDEREGRVRECLPGNNCGGCGYAGCDALAKAIAAGEAPADACPVAGPEGAGRIAAVMGQEIGRTERRTAFVRCAGTCGRVKQEAVYDGPQDCAQAAQAPGHAGRACHYGCTGLGSCARACPFDAIEMMDGIARVDRERCTACGICVRTCPFALIELVPYEAEAGVQCRSHDTGKRTRSVCEAGCIACGKCVKVCPSEAIVMDDRVAYVRQEQCIRCGKCREVCPVQVIHRPSR